MKKVFLILLLVVVIGVGLVVYIQSQKRPPVETKFVPSLRSDNTGTSEGQAKPVEVKTPPESVNLDSLNHTYQTFNNCGPATLSMILSWFGKNVSQAELADKMRPYQVRSGDNDDKTIFTHEFVEWVREYGYEAIGRVNGDINTLKNFTANGIPVVVKTWLRPGEDIGHFRIVRGFDENKQVIIQDDSYEGPNRKIKYYDFLSMWQPFNYAYMIVYTSDQEELVNAILGAELDEKVAWQNALSRAQKESELDQSNVYPWFNMSTSNYHIGNYQASLEAFEKVENKLPRRMLWYQIEPIKAYKESGNYDRVFKITNHILENGNRAFQNFIKLGERCTYFKVKKIWQGLSLKKQFFITKTSSQQNYL